MNYCNTKLNAQTFNLTRALFGVVPLFNNKLRVNKELNTIEFTSRIKGEMHSLGFSTNLHPG